MGYIKKQVNILSSNRCVRNRKNEQGLGRESLIARQQNKAISKTAGSAKKVSEYTVHLDSKICYTPIHNTFSCVWDCIVTDQQGCSCSCWLPTMSTWAWEPWTMVWCDDSCFLLHHIDAQLCIPYLGNARHWYALWEEGKPEAVRCFGQCSGKPWVLPFMQLLLEHLPPT